MSFAISTQTIIPSSHHVSSQISSLEPIQIDKIIILTLSILLGIASPLCIVNIVDALSNKRILHISNAVSSLFYLVLSFITVFFRVVPPSNCTFFRYCHQFDSRMLCYHLFVLLTNNLFTIIQLSMKLTTFSILDSFKLLYFKCT